jgi:hypothetical protein
VRLKDEMWLYLSRQGKIFLSSKELFDYHEKQLNYDDEKSMYVKMQTKILKVVINYQSDTLEKM